jgi:hypothetical protein
MADITSANEFVPSPPRTFAGLPGNGAMAAANGNVGALQGALYRASTPMMDQDSIDEVKDTLFSRVRSPEDLAAAKEARRGALTSLQQANLAEDSDWTPDRYIAYGMTKNDKPWDVTNGVQNGIALAMEADLAKQGKKYKAGVDNAKAGLDFENGEEKIDDKVEGKSLEDLTSMANAQSRINAIGAKGGAGGGMGTRWKPVAGVGLVDTWAVDPVTGESKPQVVVKAPVLAQMWQKELAAATKDAESEKNPMSFLGEDGKPDLAKRDAWIRQRANERMTGTLASQLDPQAQPDFSGQFASPPPGAPPSGAPAAAGTAPAVPTMRYNGKSGPTNASERKMAMGIAGLGGADANDPSQLPPGFSTLPAIPAVSDTVRKNTADLAAIDAALADPKIPADAKMDLEKKRQQLIAANRQALKEDIPKVGVLPKAAAPAATPSTAIPGVTMGSEADNRRDNKFSEGQATAAASLNSKAFHEPAVAAEGTLSTVNQLRSVPFTPGAFANQKKTIGNLMEAVGLKGSLVTEASNIENASKLIAQEVNSKVRAEVGVQTDSDVVRQAAESAKITDPKASFQFALNQMEENARRKIERSAFVKQMETKPEAAKTDMRTEWLKHADETLGPSMINYGGKPVFRTQFINQAVAQNPDMDPAEAKTAAAKAWLDLGKPKGKK